MNKTILVAAIAWVLLISTILGLLGHYAFEDLTNAEAFSLAEVAAAFGALGVAVIAVLGVAHQLRGTRAELRVVPYTSDETRNSDGVVERLVVLEVSNDVQGVAARGVWLTLEFRPSTAGGRNPFDSYDPGDLWSLEKRHRLLPWKRVWTLNRSLVWNAGAGVGVLSPIAIESGEVTVRAHCRDGEDGQWVGWVGHGPDG